MVAADRASARSRGPRAPVERRRPKVARRTGSAGLCRPARRARRPGRTARRRLRRSLRAPAAPTRPCAGSTETPPCAERAARGRDDDVAATVGCDAPRLPVGRTGAVPSETPERRQDPVRRTWSSQSTIPPPGTATPLLSSAATPARGQALRGREGACAQRAGEHGAGLGAGGLVGRAARLDPGGEPFAGPGEAEHQVPDRAARQRDDDAEGMAAGRGEQHSSAAAAVQVGPAARVEARHGAFRRSLGPRTAGRSHDPGPPRELDPGHEPGAGARRAACAPGGEHLPPARDRELRVQRHPAAGEGHVVEASEGPGSRPAAEQRAVHLAGGLGFVADVVGAPAERDLAAADHERHVSTARPFAPHGPGHDSPACHPDSEVHGNDRVAAAAEGMQRRRRGSASCGGRPLSVAHATAASPAESVATADGDAGARASASGADQPADADEGSTSAAAMAAEAASERNMPRRYSVGGPLQSWEPRNRHPADPRRFPPSGAAPAGRPGGAQGVSTTLPTLRRSTIIDCASPASSKANAPATTGFDRAVDEHRAAVARSTGAACRGPSTA